MTKTRLAALAFVATVAFVATAATAPAVAQDGNATAVPAESEIIDENTRLISAEFDEESGEAVVTIESDALQDIVISDAGAFVQGGEVRQRTVTAKPGERTTIRMPVTKVDGYTGVSIATRQTLYAVPIKTSADMFSGSATWETAQTAAVGGAVGVLAITGVLAYRLRTGGRKSSRRIS